MPCSHRTNSARGSGFHRRLAGPEAHWQSSPRRRADDRVVLMPRTISRLLRDEALSLLDKRGSILELARSLSRVMIRENIPGVVIGGIAVVLHGHVRSTKDIDIFVDQALEPLASVLRAQ